MRKLGISIAALAGLLATSSVASAQVFCVIPLMISAAVVSANENRELTQREAMWCGLVRDQAPAKTVRVKKKKKVAKTERRQ